MSAPTLDGRARLLTASGTVNAFPDMGPAARELLPHVESTGLPRKRLVVLGTSRKAEAFHAQATRPRWSDPLRAREVKFALRNRPLAPGSTWHAKAPGGARTINTGRVS